MNVPDPLRSDLVLVCVCGRSFPAIEPRVALGHETLTCTAQPNSVYAIETLENHIRRTEVLIEQGD